MDIIRHKNYYYQTDFLNEMLTQNSRWRLILRKRISYRFRCLLVLLILKTRFCFVLQVGEFVIYEKLIEQKLLLR